jgi:Protein of unknown function (DUF2971)
MALVSKGVQMNQDDVETKLAQIFMPYIVRELSRVKEDNVDFVHYTTADAARSIIVNNCIWLRNSLLMNDYSEVQHGLRCLEFAWGTDHGLRLRALMDQIQEGMSQRFAEAFDGNRAEFLHETYLLSISEHGDAVEDRYGRLSMWRAYGSTTSVAMVFHQQPFVSPSDALKAYTSPVFYGDPEDYAVEFAKVVEGIEANIDFLKEVGGGGDWLYDTLMDTFRNSVLSTKHPSFREEREWRVIYNPHPNPSPNILKDDVSINGTPQRIYKIPFINHPDEGFTGATLPEALKRLIIGPTLAPYPTFQTLHDLLQTAGVQDVGEKLVCSFIPLRN